MERADGDRGKVFRAMTQGSKGALSSFYGSTERSRSRRPVDAGRRLPASPAISERGAERTRNKVSNAARVGDSCCFGLLDFAAFYAEPLDLMAVT